MRKKVLVILICIMLMITSTITIIKPENLDVKATGGGGGGDDVGINTTYIHSIAENLSYIVKNKNYPKGRAFGTSGERHASELIMDWMNETGLSNVHLENIKGTSQHPKLNATEDINSEGIYIGNQRLTECYISPLTNYTNDSVAHNYSYQNLDVRRPLLFPWVDHLFNCKSFLNELLARENNDSIYDYSTFFDFCMEQFEEKYNFNISTFNVSDPDTYPSWCNGTLPNYTDCSPFLYILVDDNFNPNFSIPPLLNLLFAKRNPLGTVNLFYYKFWLYAEMWWWNLTRPNFKGLIKYDFNNDTYNMQFIDNIILQWISLKLSLEAYNRTTPHQPVLFITGHDGKPLNDSIPDFLHPSNTKVSFWVNETHNDSIISSDVIGQINGTNPNKTVIISCLYDNMWNQGASDSAIGMATVLAIAKYMKDHHIKPKYTVKFIAFSGEEEGGIGAQYYNDTHTKENITTIIDLNQLGFNQTGPKPQTFFVDTDNKSLIPALKYITSDTNYCERSGTPFLHFEYSKNGGPSDSGTLVQRNHSRTSILFIKDMNWTMHHRDGENHTKGDTMDYYNPIDVAATADMVWNVTKYFTVNPNCTIDGTVTYNKTDSPNDQDNLKDTIKATIPMKSILPQDLVRVKAKLIKKGHSFPSATINQDFIITNTTKSYIMNITLPPYCSHGNYSAKLYLYNSTGRINDSINKPKKANASSQSGYFDLYPRGNEPPVKPSKPNGNTSLRIGEEGTWNSTTSDPNHDLVGEQWYSKYSIIPPYVKFADTGLYNPVSTTPSVSRRFWAVGTHHIKVKAYDQYSGLMHPYESPYSEVLNVSVGPYANIANPQQQLHQDQGNVLHLVQGATSLLYGSQSGASSPTWDWSFHDTHYTGFGHASTQNASHAYNYPGIYNITLNVTDSQTQLTGSITIRVRVSALDSNFNMSYFHGEMPNTPISFRNVSKAKTLNHITNCTWNFGDGTISYQSNVNHTFTEEGDYNVTLTVKDNQNNIDVDYCVLHITSDPMPPEIPEVQSPGTITNASDATILAVVDPTDRNISSVKVQITTPDNASGNYTMTNLCDDVYMFTLNNSSLTGQYNFTVWATDTENNTNSSRGSYFLMLPVLFYVPPTPDDGASVNHSWVKVNVSVNDTCNTSAFIDWNRTLHGYWPMDIYNDTFIYDGSTYQNDGMLHNGMNSSSITTGKYGKGLQFDGSDDYVDLGNDTSLNLGTGDFTFMVWEKSHASSYPNTTAILSNQPENANWNGYLCGVKNTTFFYTVQNGQTTLINGTHDVTDNTWHHLAFVRKGNNLSLYVDRAFDTGRTGTVRNVTNNKDTCFSYKNRADWYHFDGVLDEAQLFNRALGREEINASYNNGLYRLCHNFIGLADGTYQYCSHAIDVNGSQGAAEVRQVTIDTVAPTIVNAGASPTVVDFGGNVSINTNVTDDRSGVKNVSVSITYPSGLGINNPVLLSLNHLSGSMYQGVFSDTWQTGRYNFTIIAYDNAGNRKTSTGHGFNVSVSASMSISTLKDSYTGNQYINITDPPNSPQNLTHISRGLTWNIYSNASSGTNILETYQEPVNYQENNGTWTPINGTLCQLSSGHPAYGYGYRLGNNRGLFGVYFKPNIQSDWPVAFTYNRSTDPNTYVVRSKLVGVGYVDPQSNWAYQNLQNVQSSQGQTNGDSVTYAGAFTGTNVTWSYGNTELKEAITMSNATKTVLQNHPPSLYGLHDSSSYLVFITKLDYQILNLYNSSGLLTGNVTISDTGVDLRDTFGQFKCGLPLGDVYEVNNESVWQKLTYRIVHLHGDTYLLSGVKVSEVTAMTFPVVIDPTLNVYSTSSDGFIYNSGSIYPVIHDAVNGTVNSTAAYISIGQKKVTPSSYSVYRGFVFFNTSALPSNAYLDSAILSLYKKDDYSATDFNITIQSGEPTGQQSGQPSYPHNPLQAGDYNQSHYLGDGGSLNTTNLVNGHNNITLTYLNWINKTGTTKLCLRSSRDINRKTPTGNEYINVYSADAQGGPAGCKPKLIITYRNQSKIKDTGSTTIKGYLLIQVQFYNTSQGKWLVDQDTVNETSPRTINGGSQLALDSIFNGHVRASDLTHGTGTYRVYAAFRDPNGSILKTSSGVELKAWWQFSKT